MYLVQFWGDYIASFKRKCKSKILRVIFSCGLGPLFGSPSDDGEADAQKRGGTRKGVNERYDGRETNKQRAKENKGKQRRKERNNR